MAKYRGDRYIIERDERDIGGGLVRLCIFDNWADAYLKWLETKTDCRRGVQLWLLRLRGGIDDPAHTDAIECKSIDD